MIRDTFFSLHRFVDLCRKEMVENWRTYILRSVMVYGVMAIVFIWSGYLQYEEINMSIPREIDPIWKFEFIVFLWGLVIWGAISASFAMERMKTKTSRTVVLMTPATMFEKFFSRWLVATCGFIVVFLIAFKMADWTRVLVYTLKFPGTDVISSFPLLQLCNNSGLFYEASADHNMVSLFISGYLVVQSFFLLGSAIWPKNALIKTFAAGVVITIVYIMVGLLFAKMFFPDNFLKGNVGIEDTTAQSIVVIVNWCFIFFNWGLAYFRFKESEIINRW